MQTPPGLEGQITEDIMRDWREANPNASVETYNATYSAVLKTVRIRLAAESKKARPSPVRYKSNAAAWARSQIKPVK